MTVQQHHGTVGVTSGPAATDRDVVVHVDLERLEVGEHRHLALVCSVARTNDSTKPAVVASATSGPRDPTTTAAVSSAAQIVQVPRTNAWDRPRARIDALPTSTLEAMTLKTSDSVIGHRLVGSS